MNAKKTNNHPTQPKGGNVQSNKPSPSKGRAIPTDSGKPGSDWKRKEWMDDKCETCPSRETCVGRG